VLILSIAMLIELLSFGCATEELVALAEMKVSAN
jgi:hypothetical protein